jgi:hypothetical protein
MKKNLKNNCEIYLRKLYHEFFEDIEKSSFPYYDDDYMDRIV